ncbi:MAG: tRNA (adenosine(37)-N6)-threonylcarbamoyltransferase complex dimerization subunit type 1 TsaB [Clostridia bacterium]|nr:tRNA (adenosine(37)-N6)-threonylcarbamoyltransferase complex dimerization subunit type 1 TsaB [Clostridia bacterium]
MKILAIDCTAKPASVAVLEDGKVLSSAYTNTGLTHSQTLVPMVHSALTNAQLELSSIDRFAINAGPGSFTGVRIGVAALKGLVFSEESTCVPVSTLESMAYLFEGLGLEDCDICPAMDARRNQVYTALFRWEAGKVHRLMEDTALPVPELLERLKEQGRPVLFVGDGAELCFEAAKDVLPDCRLAPEALRYQNAVAVAACAAAKLEAGEAPVRSEEILPVYLRAPQAERELKKKQKEN